MGDPPLAWDTMVELLAVAPAEEPVRRGLLDRLGRLGFMSAAGRLNERMEADLRRLGLATVEPLAERLPEAAPSP